MHQLSKRCKMSITNGKNRASGKDHTLSWYHITPPCPHLFSGFPHPHSVPTSLTLTRRHNWGTKINEKLFISFLSFPLNQKMVSKCAPVATHIRISCCLVNIHPTSVPTKCLGQTQESTRWTWLQPGFYTHQVQPPFWAAPLFACYNNRFVL